MASADVPVRPWLVDTLVVLGVGAVGLVGYARDDQAAQAAVDQAADETRVGLGRLGAEARIDADRAQGGG